jgi:hypothetical protein
MLHGGILLACLDVRSLRADSAAKLLTKDEAWRMNFANPNT